MKKFFNKLRHKTQDAAVRACCFLTERKGDLATNTIGAIIIAVVIIGLLVAAVNKFFPTFFSGMFSSMQSKLNANW